jgi:2-hydroxycyclohexanecarboxyl-CoA dehydrogenase
MSDVKTEQGGQRLALVAGAAGGMGGATVARLARDGFRVAAFDVNADGLREALQGLGDQHRAYTVDITDEQQVRDAVGRVEAEMGPIDALVDLVGWCETRPFLQESSDYWKKIIAINYEGVLYLTHAVLGGMVERKRGRIVYVSSDAGRVGQSGEAVYAGAKGGVIAFAKSLAREVARYGITVNCTAPGPTDTPLEAQQDMEVINRIIRHIPFRRMARPEEQAAAIAFLVSDDANFITGQTLSVSGGLTMS